MEREAERKAFARAKGYLNYQAAAKWTALAAAAGTGLLYVALLVLLWLFADLMVHRGHVPHFRDLTAEKQQALLKQWQAEPPQDVAKFLQDLGVEQARIDKLTQKPQELTPQEQELVWRLHTYHLLRRKVNGHAAALVLPRFQELPEPEQKAFKDWWAKVPDHEKRIGEAELPDARLNGDPLQLKPEEQDLVWRAYLYHLLRDPKRDDKADFQARSELEAQLEADAAQLEAGQFKPPADPLADKGILSLIVRTSFQNPAYSGVAGFLAQGWMWKGFTTYLTGLLIVALVIVTIRAVLGFLEHEMAGRATVAASTRLRRAVYHHTFRLGTLAIKDLGPSEAVTIFTRHVEAVHDALYTWLTVSFREPIKFFLLLAFSLVVHPLLAVIFLLCALLVWLAGGQVAGYFRRQGRAATNRAAEQLTLIRESLMLMRLVKVYLMELFNQARVERLLARYAALQRRRYRGEAIYLPLFVFLGSLAVLLLLFVAGLVVLHDALGVAGAITLATALVSLYWPLRSWLEHRKYLRRGREASVVLFRFLDRPGEVGQMVGAEFLPPLARRLEFDGVSLRDPGSNRMLLQDVSLTIQAGWKVAVVGAEDQEKHALVYLIPRFLDPTAGEVRIDEHNLRYVTLDSLRGQIAMVMQHNLVFHDTVANNISCGDPAYGLPQIIEAAKVAHAHHFIQKLPQGYETPIGELGHALSASEQFRVGLARAILRDPALLVVEEPASPLDDDTKALVDDTFTRVLPGRTVIFLPHRISTIRSCDQVFLLHKGRLEAAGDHRELLSQNPLYRHLHYIEFNEIAEQV